MENKGVCYDCRFYNRHTKWCKLADNPPEKIEDAKDSGCVCFEEKK
jgi:hypothetical protein